jgi:hypothetical protein
MLCTRCHQREAHHPSSPEVRAAFEKEFGTPWPFPDGICRQCWAEWLKIPENQERMEAAKRAMDERFRKEMKELSAKARAAALKVLDFADTLAGKF